MTSKFWHELGRPRAWCTAVAVAGSRCCRLTEVLIMMPMSAGSMPLSLIALAPAMAAPSTNVTPAGHQRRSRMPTSRSSRPGRSRTRWYVSASRSSMAAEVTTSEASAVLTVRIAVLVKWCVVLPRISSFPSSAGRLPYSYGATRN